MKLLTFFLLVVISVYSYSQDDYDKARTHFGENQLDSARYYINKELGRKPGAPEYFLSGMIHESQGMDLRALADYEAVVKYDPQNLEAYFQKGLIYYNSGSSENAIRDFTYVIINQSSSATKAIYFANDPYGKKGTFLTTLQSMLGRIYQYRGLAYQKSGETAKAFQDFNKSFEYDSLADFFINRSGLYTEMNQSNQAINDLKSAIELEPDNYLAWYNLALLDPKVRLPEYLLNDDEFSPMLNLMGANAYESGEYALSASYHSRAIENNPKDELAYLNRGKALLKNKDYTQARADFLKALQINANKIEAFYLIGNSFFYENNFEDAIGFYERYLSVDPGYKNVWYNAAMAYLSVDKLSRACECLENSEKLGMDLAAEQLEKHCGNQ
ncbi:MAG: tetratricopeptide repeat protein [Cyclobacteriaceae bacterium]